jgi:hypothetical protein
MNKLLSWRLAIQKTDLPATTRLVLLNLSIYMNGEGESCFPSTRRQAADTGLSERAVITHLDRAVQAGFLQKQPRGLRGSRWKAHEYKLLLPESAEPCSVLVSDNQTQAAEPYSVPQEDGAERGGGKALNEVQSNSSDNSTEYSGEHFWAGEIIKLDEKDFRAWQAVAGVDEDTFDEYLERRDQWLQSRPAGEQAHWFMSTARDIKNQFRKSGT